MKNLKRSVILNNIMFTKAVISLAFFILAAGFNCSHALAASMIRQHEENSPVTAFPELNIKPSDRLSNKQQHYCPINTHIMNGASCKMGFAPFKNSGSSSMQKECFIANECGGHPFGSETTVFQIDHKVVAAVMSDGKITLECFIFSCMDFFDFSQEYFKAPYKPPERLS